MTEDTKDDTSLNMTSVSHATNFGSQMNQLITNMKPIIPFPSTKITPKLSSNAHKILFIVVAVDSLGWIKVYTFNKR